MPDQDTHPASLGEWIRQRRKALDLTQATLADLVGCSVVTIRKWEQEIARPARATASRLAACLEIPVDERALFMQVARGERSADRLPPARAAHARTPRHSAEGPIAPLPLDRVPLPAPLPRGSRMPLRRNPLFVGRVADLRALAQALTDGGTAAIGQIAAATGLGGIGKTQLACEFVHRYGQYFGGGVCWLSFADPAAVPAEVAACGGVDGMQLSAAFDTLPLEQQVQQVRAAWKESVPRLLVFDNCEDAALLEAWRPPHGGCRVLLTSRRQHWNPALGVQPLHLDVLPRADSLALLRGFRPDLADDNADLAALAEALGDLPLALHLAGSFLVRYRYALTPAQYLQRLQTPTILDDRSLQAVGLSPTQHVQHVARTFEQSYERLDAAVPTDALALTLLAHAACFAPGESLPRWLLLQTLHLSEEDAECTLLAEDALTRLIDLGLLDTDATGNLRLHRLVVAFVQAVLGNRAAQAVVEATVLRVADDLNERRNAQRLLTVQPHLRCIVAAAQPRADAQTAALCNALGFHLWLLGVYAEAYDYHAQAFAIRQRVLGLEHPETVRSLNRVGGVRWAQGHYAEAQGYLEHALAIRQRVLGDDHPDTAQSLTSLGVVLVEQGRYAEAERYHARALAIKERVLGDHPDTALSLNNLGDVFEFQGQYAAAQRCYEQAVVIWERALGTDHPDTALGRFNLGSVFKAQGQYATAQGYLEQALAIRQRVLGDDHPDTAVSRCVLGEVLYAQGKMAQAQRSLAHALAVFTERLGMEHPNTALSLNTLGLVLQAHGQYPEAQAHYAQALAIRQRTLGPDHPHTAASLNNLGGVLQAQGRYPEAQAYYEQALAIVERVLGPDHPTTRVVGENLATLRDQSQPPE